MSKLSDEDRNRAMLAMNQTWTGYAAKLIEHANKFFGSAGGEVVSASMLSVAIGFELKSKGFRQLALDLNAIAKNFATLADQIDDADDIEKYLSASGGQVSNSQLSKMEH